MKLAHLVFAASRHLHTLLDAAERRVQTPGGSQHNDLWRQIDGKESK